MNPIIKAHQLSVGYRNGKQITTVIRNLDVIVSQGELIGIIGQNGIGKSTLLRTLARLQDPLDGDIILFGQPFRLFSRNEFAQKVSFVSTEILKLNHCTVRQLVSLGRSPYTNWFGQLSDKDNVMVSEAIEMVGLTSLAERYINEISDGERQRVMIARTLAQDTDIIVLDEPTAFLDMPNKYEVIHLLNELTRTKKKTILFTSHDLNIAMREADRLWILTPGAFIEGAPEDLVLQHFISGLFDETRLKFDPRKGEFSIRRKPIGSCKLSGKGVAHIWTKRALERLGFDTELDSEGYSLEIIVEEKAGNTIWRVKQQNSEKEFKTISELATFLKNTISEC
ncbi:MAG TPA: ABC transporter ATP-binding protein [Bacteroidales bacterium]